MNFNDFSKVSAFWGVKRYDHQLTKVNFDEIS